MTSRLSGGGRAPRDRLGGEAFAVLTAAVLVIIGIGVSVVGGLPHAFPLQTYGSPPMRFEAGFPNDVVGNVQVAAIKDQTLYVLGEPDGSFVSVYALVSSSSPLTGIPPAEVGTTRFEAGGYRTLRTVADCGATTRSGKAGNGKAIFLCQQVEAVSGHGAHWLVDAVSPSRSIAESFVDTFRPS